MAPPRPLLFGPSGRPLPLSPSRPEFSLSRSAAKRTGSMKNWIPRMLTSRQQEAFEREEISRRSSDLVNSDPNVAGITETIASTVIGSGLMPHFRIDAEELGIEKDVARSIQKQQRKNMRDWWQFADAGGRMNFGQIQYLIKRNMVEFGEYIVLAVMIDEPGRPFSLACQVVHPMRLKTPIDKINDPNIRDGVVLGKYGEPVAYWIKKASVSGPLSLSDNSKNYIRVERKAGHRFKVFHGFIQRSPEQVRGVPELSVAMKMSLDLKDLLDAELVSNIVTAAFSMFIETKADAHTEANKLSYLSETDALGNTTRQQEMEPGIIMYGNAGDVPHTIDPRRPGTTFEPFTKLIKKSMALSVGLPYPIAFKDVEGVTFAGFRSAMLEAWRLFSTQRQWMGDDFCQPINVMLQEEAWLRGRLNVKEFYIDMRSITSAEWRGAPKGDIEPFKAAQADVMLINNNLKTHEEGIIERGGSGTESTFDKLGEEWEKIETESLPDSRVQPGDTEQPPPDPDNEGVDD